MGSTRVSEDERFDDVVYMIEANSFEQLMLWKENDERKGIRKVKWEQDCLGYGGVIGYMRSYGCTKSYPVSISCFFTKLNEKRIVFYEAVSMVVNRDMIRKWIKGQCPEGTPNCDAMNFHQCLSMVREFPSVNYKNINDTGNGTRIIDGIEYAIPGCGTACGAANDCCRVRGHLGDHINPTGYKWPGYKKK